MRQIAIYGKGGIGKSTTSSNLSAAFSKAGKRVLHIGCDPKQDSTKNLLKGKVCKSVLDVLREKGEASEIVLDDVVSIGFNGVHCVESGGPEPGIGCAGKGILTAFEILKDLNGYKVINPDVVIYDILGDVVCGGFSMPIRNGYAEEIYLVTSGEMMSLYAANNICKAIIRFTRVSNVKLAGIICNSKNIPNEERIVDDFAKEIGTTLIHIIPRNVSVQECENYGTTVIEGDPKSQMSEQYCQLAEKVLALKEYSVPKPMGNDYFELFLKKYYIK